MAIQVPLAAKREDALVDMHVMWILLCASIVAVLVPVLAYGITQISLATSGVFIVAVGVFFHAALIRRACLHRLNAGLYTKPCRRFSSRFVGVYNAGAAGLAICIAGLIVCNVGTDIGGVSLIVLTPVRLLYFAGFLVVVALKCAVSAMQVVDD